MTITIKKYIDITSGVAGAAQADRRELMQRIFTTNPLVPVNGLIEITTLDEVRTYFGEDSEEYKRSVAYFGFISKSFTTNSIISFSGYSTVPVASLIIGDQQNQVLTTLNAITAATLTITIGGLGGTTDAIDLSAAGTISTAMTIIETKIQALDLDPSVASATVVYDPVGKRVTLTAGATGENAIVFSSATSGFLDTLGWAAGSAVSNGSDGETITEALALSDSASDNFGAFAFAETLSIADVEAAAIWNHGLNVKYIYCVPVSAADAQLYRDTLADYSGAAVTLNTEAAEDYSESIPAILLGATNYDGVNSTINYMYQQAGYPVSVDDTATSDAIDALLINYNGQTQQAGKNISFYQRGVMMGAASAPINMNVYANEIWFKDAINTAFMNLFLSINKVSANTAGKLTLTGTMQSPINQALTNGTISVGKKLTDLAISSINALTGDEAVAAQVENAGYWLDIEFVVDGIETNAEYTLIYSKDDVVRKITGSQVLV